jgi:hypothetical protein
MSEIAKQVSSYGNKEINIVDPNFIRKTNCMEVYFI